MQVRKEGLWLKALSSISTLSLQVTPNPIPCLFGPPDCCHQAGGNSSGHLFLLSLSVGLVMAVTATGRYVAWHENWSVPQSDCSEVSPIC